MGDIFNDPIKSFKNFNMLTEIDIAGTFIYNGMKELDTIESFYNKSEIFTFLYLISVGIERIQKVLIVLIEEISNEKIEEFEESLITHSHQNLHDRIKEQSDIKFNSRQNGFLQVINNFYKSYRYGRFSINSEYNSEDKILIDYIKQNLKVDIIQNDLYGYKINTLEVKEFMGRVIGSIARLYYNEIYNQASKQNLYTYELRYNSKAAKIFMSDLEKESLQQQIVNEQMALKEFIIFLINTKSENSFYKFIKSINPLDFDMALSNEYLESICKGTIPSGLLDEAEHLYCKSHYSKDRIEMINCIGNGSIDFDMPVIQEIDDILNCLISNKYDCIIFIEKISTAIESLDVDEFEILDEISKACDDFIEKNMANKEEFIENIKVVYDRFKHYFYYEE